MTKRSSWGSIERYKPGVYQIRDLDRLTKRDVQEWLDGMSYGAAKSCFAVLRAMYSFAED